MTGSLPKRYARALLELAKEEDQVGPFAEGLAGLAQSLEKSSGTLEALSNDSFHMAERLAAMEALSKKAGLSGALKNFFLVLVKKNRMILLPEIAREYKRLHDEILGIIRVSVVTPKLPEPLVLKRIERILSERLKKQVLAHGEARPEMIGGLILKIDHMIYDGSVQRELEKIRENLLKG